MSGEGVYNAWKDKERQIDVGESFTDELMNQVYRYEQEKSREFAGLRLLVAFISEQPLAQAGLVVAGAIVGLVRLAFVVCVFLKP